MFYTAKAELIIDSCSRINMCTRLHIRQLTFGLFVLVHLSLCGMHNSERHQSCLNYVKALIFGTPESKFLRACSRGDMQLVKTYLDNGVGVNAGYGDVEFGAGFSALGFAGLHKRPDLAKLLLQHGAKTTDEDKDNLCYETPLEWAVGGDQEDKVADTTFVLLLWGNYSKQTVARALNKAKSNTSHSDNKEIVKMLTDLNAYKLNTKNKRYKAEIQEQELQNFVSSKKKK